MNVQHVEAMEIINYKLGKDGHFYFEIRWKTSWLSLAQTMLACGKEMIEKFHMDLRSDRYQIGQQVSDKLPPLMTEHLQSSSGYINKLPSPPMMFLSSPHTNNMNQTIEKNTKHSLASKLSHTLSTSNQKGKRMEYISHPTVMKPKALFSVHLPSNNVSSISLKTGNTKDVNMTTTGKGVASKTRTETFSPKTVTPPRQHMHGNSSHNLQKQSVQNPNFKLIVTDVPTQIKELTSFPQTSLKSLTSVCLCNSLERNPKLTPSLPGCRTENVNRLPQNSSMVSIHGQGRTIYQQLPANPCEGKLAAPTKLSARPSESKFVTPSKLSPGNLASTNQLLSNSLLFQRGEQRNQVNQLLAHKAELSPQKQGMVYNNLPYQLEFPYSPFGKFMILPSTLSQKSNAFIPLSQSPTSPKQMQCPTASCTLASKFTNNISLMRSPFQKPCNMSPNINKSNINSKVTHLPSSTATRQSSSPMRFDARHPSPMCSDVRQPSPVHSDVRYPSLMRSDLRHPSPMRSDVRQPSLVDSDVRQPSPVHSDVRHPSPMRSDVRHPSSMRSDVRYPSPMRSDVRHPSPVRSDVRQPSPVRSDVKKPSTNILPTGSKSEEKSTSNNKSFPKSLQTIPPVTNQLATSTKQTPGKMLTINSPTKMGFQSITSHGITPPVVSTTNKQKTAKEKQHNATLFARGTLHATNNSNVSVTSAVMNLSTSSNGTASNTNPQFTSSNLIKIVQNNDVIHNKDSGLVTTTLETVWSTKISNSINALHKPSELYCQYCMKRFVHRRSYQFHEQTYCKKNQLSLLAVSNELASSRCTEKDSIPDDCPLQKGSENVVKGTLPEAQNALAEMAKNQKSVCNADDGCSNVLKRIREVKGTTEVSIPGIKEFGKACEKTNERINDKKDLHHVNTLEQPGEPDLVSTQVPTTPMDLSSSSLFDAQPMSPLPGFEQLLNTDIFDVSIKDLVNSSNPRESIGTVNEPPVEAKLGGDKINVNSGQPHADTLQQPPDGDNGDKIEKQIMSLPEVTIDECRMLSDDISSPSSTIPYDLPEGTPYLLGDASPLNFDSQEVDTSSASIRNKSKTVLKTKSKYKKDSRVGVDSTKSSDANPTKNSNEVSTLNSKLKSGQNKIGKKKMQQIEVTDSINEKTGVKGGSERKKSSKNRTSLADVGKNYASGAGGKNNTLAGDLCDPSNSPRQKNGKVRKNTVSKNNVKTVSKQNPSLDCDQTVTKIDPLECRNETGTTEQQASEKTPVKSFSMKSLSSKPILVKSSKTTPNKIVSSERNPAEPVSSENIPKKSVSRKSVWKTTPAKSLSSETTPAKSLSSESTPTETVSSETTQAKSLLSAGIPAKSVSLNGEQYVETLLSNTLKKRPGDSQNTTTVTPLPTSKPKFSWLYNDNFTMLSSTRSGNEFKVFTVDNVNNERDDSSLESYQQDRSKVKASEISTADFSSEANTVEKNNTTGSVGQPPEPQMHKKIKDIDRKSVHAIQKCPGIKTKRNITKKERQMRNSSGDLAITGADSKILSTSPPIKKKKPSGNDVKELQELATVLASLREEPGGHGDENLLSGNNIVSTENPSINNTSKRIVDLIPSPKKTENAIIKATESTVTVYDTITESLDAVPIIAEPQVTSVNATDFSTVSHSVAKNQNYTTVSQSGTNPSLHSACITLYPVTTTATTSRSVRESTVVSCLSSKSGIKGTSPANDVSEHTNYANFAIENCKIDFVSEADMSISSFFHSSLDQDDHYTGQNHVLPSKDVNADFGDLFDKEIILHDNTFEFPGINENFQKLEGFADADKKHFPVWNMSGDYVDTGELDYLKVTKFSLESRKRKRKEDSVILSEDYVFGQKRRTRKGDERMSLHTRSFFRAAFNIQMLEIKALKPLSELCELTGSLGLSLSTSICSDT